jgi:hypothetical protein
LGGAKNSPSAGKRFAPASSQYGDMITGMENFLTSYDDLVKQGRISARDAELMKRNQGMTGDETRLGHDISIFQGSLAEGDPGFAAYQKAVISGLEGIENGGIPDDMRRTITEQLRQSQAARGIIDSNVAGVEEVVRLMGGSEQVRSRRIAEAENYFGSVTSMSLNALYPSIGQLMGYQQGQNQLNLSRAQGNQQIRQGQVDQGLNVVGTIIGGVAGGAV